MNDLYKDVAQQRKEATSQKQEALEQSNSRANAITTGKPQVRNSNPLERKRRLAMAEEERRLQGTE